MDNNNNNNYQPYDPNQQPNQYYQPDAQQQKQYYQAPDAQQQNQYYQAPDAPQQNQYYQMPNAPVQPTEEKASVGLAILSFLIPLAGLIIFLTKKDEKPKTAKVSGICALVSFIINIAFSVIMTVTGGLLAGSLADDAIDDIYDDDSAYSDIIGSDDGESTIVTDGVLGDYTCVIKDAYQTTDYEGNDAVVVTFDFTNNSTEAISFDVALYATVYQDGVELDYAYIGDDEIDNSSYTDIKPGTTLEVCEAYELRNTTSDIEVEVEELFSLTDEKVCATFSFED